MKSKVTKIIFLFTLWIFAGCTNRERSSKTESFREPERKTTRENFTEKQNSEATIAVTENSYSEDFVSIFAAIESYRNEVKQVFALYEALLAEQKKKTIDSVNNDFVINNFIQNGNKYETEKNFSKSYECFRNALLLQSENNEVRAKKIKSLFYINPMDSSSYAEILGDIALLKKSGELEQDILKIENFILQEEISKNKVDRSF